MALIDPNNDLMVVQKINGIDNPVVSMTLEDLHSSLESFDEKVSIVGDTMTGQLGDQYHR